MRKALADTSDKTYWKKNGVKNVLSKKNACYVLITCGEPSEDGKMQVEMTYEGDACLAAYLIESARGFIDSEDPS